MTFDIEIAGHSRVVTVEPVEGTRFRVTLDGRPHVVDAVRAGDLALSLIVDGETGTSCEAAVVPGGAPGESQVWLDGRSAIVTIDGRRSRRRGDRSPGMAAGESVVAPMPGRIVRLLVGAGDEVALRQPVLVIEAMKMENELRSPGAGRVKDVLVAEGASVDAGSVLIVIEK